MPDRRGTGEAHPAAGRNGDVEDIWRLMVALVFDNRDEWRRSVSTATGLPFSRVRILKRVAVRPMVLKELTVATGMDAPATSVAVTDLEDAGLVQRAPVADDRRRKLVTITDAGREVLTVVADVPDPAPGALHRMSAGQRAELHRLLREVAAD